MILKDTATFQVLLVVSLFCTWNITSVEISTYLKVKSTILFTSGGLGLVILVLVLRIWSCLHHCDVGCIYFSQPGWCQPVRQEFMENECEALPGVAFPRSPGQPQHLKYQNRI